MRTRLASNKEILKRLAKAVKENPDQRFGQLLRNLDVIVEIRNQQGIPSYWQNDFNTESVAILGRMMKANGEFTDG